MAESRTVYCSWSTNPPPPPPLILYSTKKLLKTQFDEMYCVPCDTVYLMTSTDKDERCEEYIHYRIVWYQHQHSVRICTQPDVILKNIRYKCKISCNWWFLRIWNLPIKQAFGKTLRSLSLCKVKWALEEPSNNSYRKD